MLHKIYTHKITTFIFLLQLPLMLSAQHNEAIDDPYMPPSQTASPQVSPAFQYSGANIFVTQVNVDAEGNNILNDAGNEPSLAVNPKDPTRMAIGWRQFDNIQSNFRQAGFGYTTDGGQLWTFPGVINPGVFRSDPVLASDADGLFFYNSLTVDDNNNFHCDVYRATGDDSWDGGVYAIGGDKAWMTIDQTEGPGKGHIYSNWSSNYSDCPNDSDFTRSTDQGANYEYCETFTTGIYWGTNSVGPDGTLYMGGNGGEVLWSLNAQNAGESVAWEGNSLADLNYSGQGWNGQSPNPAGILGQCYIATNHAPGPLYGQVYVLQSVHQDGVDDPRDVMFSSSSDGGETWSPAVRINDDNAGPEWQWFGTMSVAPNGRIDVVWLDTRDDPGTVLSSLYYSNSSDGGVTWSPNERMSPSFDPLVGWPNQSKMGDYYHMVSDNGGAHLAWAATFNGEQDVYYAHITLPNSAARQAGEKLAAQLFPVTPNPFIDQCDIRYETASAGHVKVLIFNQMGVLVRTLTDQQQIAGTYARSWDGRGENGQALPGGLYYCNLSIDGQAGSFQKLVRIRH